MCVNKGTDAVMFTLLKENSRDEVARYQDGRYYSTYESAWRIFDLKYMTSILQLNHLQYT